MCEDSRKVLVEEKKTKRWLMANLIFLLSLIFFGGAWMKGIEKDIGHLQEMLDTRTEDRFYRQDGLVLEQRIIALENNYSRIEAALIRLEEKL